MTEGTHIRFFRIGPKPGQKTDRWEVHTKDNDCLGRIKWFGRWRKYVYEPDADTVYEEVCMREISQFIVDRTHEHKAAGRAVPPDVRPGLLLAALLDELYSPDEIEVWLSSGQPLFGGCTPRYMIEMGREAELVRALRAMLDGAYL